MSDNNNIDPSTGAASQLPPAGWYPDPHDSGAQRYWDGAQWTAHVAAAQPGAASPTAVTPAQVAAATVATPPDGAGAAAVRAGRGMPSLKWWQWALIAVAALVLVSILVNGVNASRGTGEAEADKPATVAEQAEDVPSAEPVDDREEIPALVGLTVAEARAALETAGFVIATPAGTGDDWVVVTQTLSEGRKADAGTEVLVTAEAPKPVYTLAQQNAIRKAQSYLDYSGFSRVGLIDQLEYEGYSTEDATFGADNAGADWNAEAAEKAASYLEYSSFSREGLYDQLAFEGFTDAEIQFALAAVGY